jgi:hypothetical protein
MKHSSAVMGKTLNKRKPDLKEVAKEWEKAEADGKVAPPKTAEETAAAEAELNALRRAPGKEYKLDYGNVRASLAHLTPLSLVPGCWGNTSCSYVWCWGVLLPACSLFVPGRCSRNPLCNKQQVVPCDATVVLPCYEMWNGVS